MKVLDIFSGIGSFQSGPRARRNDDRCILRKRRVLPAYTGEALAPRADI